MRADPANPPQIGVAYQVNMDRMPSRIPFTLMFGFKCQRIDLGFLRAPGCVVHTDYPVVHPLVADANGEMKLHWTLPNSLALVGLHMNSQAVVFDWGVPAQFTVTNALRLIISD